jgi:hypothetical protein
VTQLKPGEPLGSGRRLDASHRQKTGSVFMPQGQEVLDCIARQLRHRLRRVGLENEPGGMRARAARGGKGALVYDRNVAPAELHEMLGDRATDQTRSHDDYLGVFRHGRS